MAKYQQFEGIEVSHDFRTEKGHHRVEIRKVWAVPVAALGGIYKQEQWTDIQTIVCVERVRHLWNKTTQEVQFYLSFLPVDAQLNGRVIRQHWGIKNQVHWTLDVTFNEDKCRIRSLNSPQNLALLRRMALNAINQETTLRRSLRQKKKRAAMNDDYMMQIQRVLVSSLIEMLLPCGGKEQRTFSSVGRVPVSFDNTLSAGMRGDYAVPTLFNGNFDQFIPNKSDAENLGRNTISQEIPGWSFHNSATSKLVSPINNLVEWSQIAQQYPNFSNYLSLLGINSQAQNYQPNYALKLGAGESITHNRFVVPDWGVLRLDIHVPESSLNKGGRLKVYLEEVGSPENVKIGEISLEESEPTMEKATRTSLREREPDGSRQTYEVNIPGNYGYDKDTIGYGSSGFETFHIDVPPSLRGKAAKLTLELQGEEPVYIDNAFFKSEVLKWGNPTEARNDLQFENNFLIKKPQYTLSYNRSKNTINWVVGN